MKQKRLRTTVLDEIKAFSQSVTTCHETYVKIWISTQRFIATRCLLVLWALDFIFKVIILVTSKVSCHYSCHRQESRFECEYSRRKLFYHFITFLSFDIYALFTVIELCLH